MADPVSKDTLVQAHEACTANRSKIEASEKVGCFYCCEVYSATEVTEFIQDRDGDTAICKCGIDSVLPDASGYPLTPEFLRSMHEHWFADAD